MEPHHLKIFTSVYRNKSFTLASKQLHISQPTVSEHIKNLEIALGCALFDRLGRTILPTIEADLLYPRALKILDDLDRLQEDLATAGDRIGGELVLGASTIPGTYILPGLAVLDRMLEILRHEAVTAALEEQHVPPGLVAFKFMIAAVFGATRV